MSDIFSLVDDKHIPVYRVLWVADVPHFCGAEDCTAEGRYEVRLDAEESIFASRDERDSILRDIKKWHRGVSGEDGNWSE